MSKSLDEAIEENNRWEADKQRIRERWRRHLAPEDSSPKPHVLRAPRTTNADDFFTRHGMMLDGYIAQLRQTAPLVADTQKLSDRADNLAQMLKGLKADTELFFSNRRDASLNQFLLDATDSHSVYYSPKHCVDMGDAVMDLGRLRIELQDEPSMLVI